MATNTNSGASYAGYASVAGSFINSWYAGQAASARINAQKEALLGAVKSNKESFITRLNASKEQTMAIDEQLSTVMSARGLQAMKTKARLKSASSSTGFTRSGTIKDLVEQVDYDEILDNQVLISRARQSKADIARQKVSDWMSFKNQGTNFTNQMGGADTGMSGAIASALGTGLQGVSAYMSAGGKFDFMNSNSSNGGTSLGSEQGVELSENMSMSSLRRW
jgi:hypothetical protein